MILNYLIIETRFYVAPLIYCKVLNWVDVNGMGVFIHYFIYCIFSEENNGGLLNEFKY